MKKLFPFFIAALLGAITWSCDNDARLAGKVTGVWTGTPENFTDNSTITASIIDTYDFQPDSCTTRGCHAGPLIVAGMISTTTQIVGDNSLIEPISIATAARSTISGSWTALDNDELLIRLDPSTLDIAVDPKDVVVNTNPYAPEDVRVDSIREGVAANIEVSLRQALLNRYASINHFDDVKIKGQLMKYEVNDFDHTLTRQQ